MFATAGSDEKCAACLKLGADAAINYRTQDFAAEVKTLTEGRGVNVILDMVGAPYMARNIRSLGMDGRLVIIAFLQGSKVQDFDFMPVMTRRLTVTGPAPGPLPRQEWCWPDGHALTSIVERQDYRRGELPIGVHTARTHASASSETGTGAIASSPGYSARTSSFNATSRVLAA